MRFLEFPRLCKLLHLPGFTTLFFANNYLINLCLFIIGSLWNISEKSQKQHAIHAGYLNYLKYGYCHS